MKNIRLLCLAFMAQGLLYLYSCKPNETPCSDPGKSYDYLSENEKQCIVYKENELVRFVSNLGDTVMLTGNALVDGFQIETIDDRPPSCPQSKLNNQFNSILLTSSNKQLFPDIKEGIYKYDLETGDFYQGLLEFSVGEYIYKMGTPFFSYTNYDSIIQIGDTSLKIITLVGKTGNPILFINRIEGIVKLDLNGRTWEKQLD